MNKALRDQVLQMSAEDRLELIDEIWESLHPPGSIRPDEPFVLSEAQKAELDRRIAEYERDPSRAIPLEEFLARLDSRTR
jgi:putative addiction module component (TIGR02574 family)